MTYNSAVRKWDVFEVTLEGRSEGNPYTDFDIKGSFSSNEEQVTVDGFYDGNGIYKVRFMPSFEGKYRFEISGSFCGEKKSGEFTVLPPGENIHGPLSVYDTHHFRYADGTPYYSLGTTCYAWVHQPQDMQEQTLRTLDEYRFNKIRFCIFPKHYDYNYNDPITFPYEGSPCDNSNLTRATIYGYMGDKSKNRWDFHRFNPEHFRHIEERIEDLRQRNIQADLILFHPYDRWGFCDMTPEEDDLYVKYAVARFSAYCNVWWSLANEYDYVKSKTVDDWERIASVICEKDAYCRLRSIHNGPQFYDFTKPWVTHCSCQGQGRYLTVELTEDFCRKYNKPVVWDEVLYEGNLDLGWGNISGEEMTRRFWEATVRGGYAGHGETYLFSADEEALQSAKLWWSHGGVLHGESPKRIAFLHDILYDIPESKPLKPLGYCWDCLGATVEGEENAYSLFYFSFLRPYYRDYHFDDVNEYSVDVIDTWNMTVENKGIFKGSFRIVLGGKPYMAIRITKL